MSSQFVSCLLIKTKVRLTSGTEADHTILVSPLLADDISPSVLVFSRYQAVEKGFLTDARKREKTISGARSD